MPTTIRYSLAGHATIAAWGLAAVLCCSEAAESSSVELFLRSSGKVP